MRVKINGRNHYLFAGRRRFRYELRKREENVCQIFYRIPGKAGLFDFAIRMVKMMRIVFKIRIVRFVVPSRQSTLFIELIGI